MTGSFKERGAANLLLQLDDGRASARGGGGERRQPRPRGRVPRRAPRHPGHDRHAHLRPAHQGTSARRSGAEVILHGANYDEAYERAREVEQALGRGVRPPVRRRARDRRPGHDGARAPRAGGRSRGRGGPGGRGRTHRRRRAGDQGAPARRARDRRGGRRHRRDAALAAGAAARPRARGADDRRRHRRAPGRRGHLRPGAAVRRRGRHGERGGAGQRDPAPARDREDRGRGRGRRARSPRCSTGRWGWPAVAWRSCSPAATST